MEQLSSANTRFAVDLFRTLKDSNPSGNIFISPMILAEHTETLHFDAVKEIHSSFQSLNADINKRGAPYILKLANRLYGEKTYEFLPIEEQLTLEKLHEWTKPENLRSIEVEVHLPRFKLEESYDLNSHLKSLGIEDLFNPKADLSGMARASDLFVSKIVHKSFVEVNEEGTEAAAATAAIIANCMYIPAENFVADHPFIFFIRHNPSTNILFLGRLSSP
ncbi:Leukocyte elastase inhibitor B [Myotis davidii]|uniref:Leukocyte elastase inhibitor B n=1 Tax=Myotis davidii TaxID=225400 RepID=L5MAU0_MYODS|nr:Leukocyte elastase inhibitor B [Myotis davidii]